MIVVTKDLPPLRAVAKAAVDAAAEAQRLLFITPGAGQAMVYSEKLAEAAAYVAATAPVDTDYPLMQCDVGLIAETMDQVAQVILNTAAAWKTVAAVIEIKRLGAKNAIDLATTPAAITAASVVNWSAP